MAYDELRQEYDGVPLGKDKCERDPETQFRAWFGEAIDKAPPMSMANAMTLATVDAQGGPHARIVLLKELDDRGFVFFTNYQSPKGQELDGCNKAELLFWWESSARQIRIAGQVHKVSAEVSDTYFASRPRESNLAAIASNQSQVLESREVLEAKMHDADATQLLVRPQHWGGYRLVATRYEFWQGRPNRAHDRLAYTRNSTGDWQITRLYP